MGIPVVTDFNVIEHKEGSQAYPALADQPWERNMKENISLEKDRIKLKWQGKKIIIPLYSKEGKPWEETNDSKECIWQLYQIMQSNADIVEPKDQGELDLGSPMSVGRNSNSDLYDGELEKYESYAKDC